MSDIQLSIEQLAYRLGLDPDATATFVKYYNDHFDDYDNRIYKRIESRVAHWANYQAGDWFTKRIDIALDYVEEHLHGGASYVDLGFSIPYTYTRKKLISDQNLSCTFVDLEPSATTFYESISHELGVINRRSLDSVIEVDLESDNTGSIISNHLTMKWKQLGKAPQNQIIVASEVLEHLDNRDIAWKHISAISNTATDQGVKNIVYITLPIGTVMPSHKVEFLKPNDVFDYLSEYGNLKKQLILEHPNPSIASPHLKACVCAFIEIK